MRRIVFVFAFLCPLVYAQVQIGKGVQVGGLVGAGSLPEGSANEVNAKLDSSNFQGSGLFTSADHSYLFTTAPQWAQYARNSPMLSYCGRQCSDVKIYGHDTPPLNGSGQATGYGQEYFNWRRGLYTAISGFNGYSSDTNDPPGGSVLSFQGDNMVFHSNAISQAKTVTSVAGKPFDTANLYSYLWCHGGYWGGGDEGCTNIKTNGGLSFARQGAFQVSGNPGVGATTVTASQVWNPDDQMVGGWIYDFNSTPIASGNITAYDSANHILTVTPGSVTPATNAGTTTTAITISSAEQNAVTGVSKTVTVNVTQGSGFTIDSTQPIYFACGNPEIESVVPTAVGSVSGGMQTITANFMHGHSAGCTVGQGGTEGVLDLVADRIGNNWKTSYFVFAAPDDSHIYEVSFLQGGRGSINPWKHNFGGGQNTITNANVTGDGTTTKVCGLGQSQWNFAGQYVQISGASPSTFNGIYTAGTLDANLCTSFPGPGVGTATGATFAVGGAINSPDGTIQGPGGFKVWATARLRQIGTTATTTNGITTNAYNNTYYFYPNNFTFTNGHVIQVLDDMQARVEPLSAVGIYDVAASNKLNGWMTVAASGYGVANPLNFRMLRVINSNPQNWYQGTGSTGQLQAPRAVSIEGMYTQGLYMDQPVTGGTGIYMETTAKTNIPNTNNAFFPLLVQGTGGGGGGLTIQYDPNHGTTAIHSGTGDGVYTSINMTPTDFSMGAGNSGTFTFTGQNYIFSGLLGTSTQCASLDSTGKLGRNCQNFGASGTGHSAGLVPDPGSTAGTTKFLREDGTWQVPAGGGGSMVYPAAGIANSTGTAWGTSYSATNLIPATFLPTFGTSAAGIVPSSGGGTTNFLRADGTWAAPPGGSGISGLTSGYIPQATSSTAIGNSFIDYGVTNAGAYTSSKDIYAPAFHSTDTGGAGFGFVGTEGTAPTGVAGSDGLWADSTTHRLMMNNNNTGAVTVASLSDQASSSAFGVVKCGTGTTCSGGVISVSGGGGGIADVTVTLPTTAIAANTCAAGTPVTMTGVTTASAFSTAFATDPSAVTGWGSSGGLSFVAWPTANTLNWKVCNVTASSITPGAMTLNVGAQ